MHSTRLWQLTGALVVVLVGVVALTVTARSQTPFTVKLEPVAQGFRQPLDVRTANDGSDRMYVVQKPGVIALLHGGAPVERPFLDIRPLVGAGGSEQGLLGLAFHPAYASTGTFFVQYTDPQGNSVVARYQVSDDRDVADPASASIVLTQAQPYANHNGGNLVFGPDGYLYIGFGDGGSAGDPQGNGQRGSTWLGKMLRIDVDGGPLYAIPADNPFVGAADTQPEVWAVGLRNPWRYSFDRATGDLYIGDVGQGNWEEIDVALAGQGGLNYGWSVAEGNHCYRGEPCDRSGFVPAAAEYGHGEGDCAVVGGFVYRGAAYPAMAGAYLYADECTGRIWALTRDAGGAWSTAALARTGVVISSFGEDDQGELYLTGFGNGVLYRVTAE